MIEKMMYSVAIIEIFGFDEYM